MVSNRVLEEKVPSPQDTGTLSRFIKSQNQINMILSLLENELLTKKGFQRICGIKVLKTVEYNIKRFLRVGVLEEISYEDSKEKYYRLNPSGKPAELITIIKKMHENSLLGVQEIIKSTLCSSGKTKVVKAGMDYDELSLSSIRKKCGLNGTNANIYIDSFLKAGILEEVTHGGSQKSYRIKKGTDRTATLVSCIEAMYAAQGSSEGQKEDDEAIP